MPSETGLVAIVVDEPEAIEHAVSLVQQGRIVVLYGSTVSVPRKLNAQNSLSETETERYQTFLSQIAADEFRTGRILMRAFYAQWFACDPQDIQITVRPHEKPQLLPFGEMNFNTQPQVSLSHSAGYIALAVHNRHPIGIDIEVSQTIEVPCLEGLNQIFTPDEITFVSECPDSTLKTQRFLTLWRAKEAIMKATGLGFSLHPNSFTVLEHNGLLSKRVFAQGRNLHLTSLRLTNAIEAACAWADHEN